MCRVWEQHRLHAPHPLRSPPTHSDSPRVLLPRWDMGRAKAKAEREMERDGRFSSCPWGGWRGDVKGNHTNPNEELRSSTRGVRIACLR